MQKKILIIYHSGSGSTQIISEILQDKLLLGHYKVDLSTIYPDFDYKKLSLYDLVLLGCPTYYFKPSCSTLEFVEKMPVLRNKMNFYIVTTYGLYSGNSVRTLAKMLQGKNTAIKGYSQIRGPASDGVLLLPSFLRFFFRYEKKVNIKIGRIVRTIKDSIEKPENNPKIPPPRWYSPLTCLFRKQIQAIDYSTYRKNLKVLDDRCNNCNVCVNNCIRKCWEKGKNKPIIDTDKCEFCLKCVHNCPKRAIVFTEKMKDSPRLDRIFYNKLRRDTFL
jgi:flavodoxin/formate hydrogenlyase subunit 6/NADH:ubiquinone oxidoreductase subunit I